MEDTPRDVQSEIEKLKEKSTKVLPLICPGGECDRRHTCKHTVGYATTRSRIKPVKSGQFCGYYME